MAAAAEQKKQYHISKSFKALNTKANRTAIQDDEFSWLENAQPIGPGNLKIIPASTPSLDNTSANVVFVANVTSMTSVEVKGRTYLATFQDDGSSQFYDVDLGNVVTIATAGTFSNSNVRAAQFNSDYAIIGDPNKGLFVYDGNTTVQLGSVGAIGMTNVGSAYNTAPSVVISPPNQAGGIQATGQAVLTGNIVSGIVLTNPGTGYTSSPTITLSGGTGTGASAVASYITFRTGTVSATVQSGGSNYTSANITFSGGGGDNSAAATAIISNGSIINVIMTNVGNNYTSAPTVTITGDGANACVTTQIQSNVVTDVATYSGRVWVSQGRQVVYSAATNFNDFISPSAGSVFITDSTLHGNILAMLSANNFLYIYGDDSINVFSDVLVNSTGTTSFTNTNISASIGSRRPFSIFPYYRYVMFQNDYGVYGLIGSTTVKLSDALDGIYPLIDFTKPISAGQVIINNILCAAFNFYCNNLVVGGSRWIQAVFFDKKWFITSQGTINPVAGSPVGGILKLFGVSGKNLYTMYQNATAPVNSTVQTALWLLTDPIRDKQALKLGVEATLTNGGSINLTVDSESNSSPTYVLSNTSDWNNNSGTIIPWKNNANATINWLSGSAGYYLYKSDAQQWGKYIGYTMTSNSSGFTYNTFELEFELRARF